MKPVKKLAFALCACLMLLYFAEPALCETEEAMKNALKTLQDFGIDVDERILPILSEGIEQMKQGLEYGGVPEEWKQRSLDKYASEPFLTYSMLQLAGMGNYDYDTGEWTPTSHKVYAFDAEIFDVEHMYTLFMQGVQAIVPDVEITEISEDLSGITDEIEESEYGPANGVRAVSFLCNGHPYSAEFPSYLDWIDLNIVGFVNEVLEKEGCAHRLQIVSQGMDQMVILIYDTDARAEQLRPYATDIY